MPTASMRNNASMDNPRVITTHVRTMIQEAMDIAVFLDDKPIGEEVEWEGRSVTPAMLLSVAQNRLIHAMAELDATRLTYFGFPER